MSLQAPEKVRKLQNTLHAKAKESPDFRFYVLYDKLYRKDVLEYAYRCCKSNSDATGVDKVTFPDIETYGKEKWLGELAEELRSKSYRAEAIRRVYIPKPNGKQRPLGIPTIKDRIVQTTAVLILAPIFEADLQSEQYAYRPGRSALDAVRRLHGLANTGHTEVIDADLKGYFDTIPHQELMKSLSRRISDKHMLKLLKMWLKMPIEETDHRGRARRSNPGKRTGRGTPQGAPISPLLSNIYMRRFILGWKLLGYERKLQAYIVNYADDFVICCRRTTKQAMERTRTLIKKLKLTLNEEKTSTRHLPHDTLEFLGYELGICYSTKTGNRYIGTRPARKRVNQVCKRISELTGRNTCLLPIENRIERLNKILTGWGNYFRLGPVSKSYRIIDSHSRYRLREWLRHKHKVNGRGTARFPDEYLYNTLGLVRLEQTTRNLPWAKA